MKIYAQVGKSYQTILEDHIPYTPEQGEILMQAERPTPNHVAQEDGTWGLDEQSIPKIANQKWAEVKTARDEAEQVGCPYMDKTLDSDTTSVQRIAIAVQAAQQAITAGAVDFTLDWTMQDNSTIKMTAEQVIGMSAALAAYSNNLHEQARQCREQIEQIAANYEAGTINEDAARAALSAIKF